MDIEALTCDRCQAPHICTTIRRPACNLYLCDSCLSECIDEIESLVAADGYKEQSPWN